MRGVIKACLGSAVGAITLATACGLGGLDALSSGGDGAGDAEAGQASDASIDGAQPIDGASDGGRFCTHVPANVFVCDDFDDDASFPDPLSIVVKGGGTVTRVSDSVRSAPFAALIVHPAATGSVGASLRQSIMTGETKLEVELDMRVDKQGPDYDVVTLIAGNAEIGFQINDDSTLSWDEQFVPIGDASTPNMQTPLGASFPTAWTHVKLTYALDPGGTTLTSVLLLDGKMMGTHTFAAHALTDTASVIVIGDRSQVAPKTEARLRVDNITIAR